jgi:hypothetical protein
MTTEKMLKHKHMVTMLVVLILIVLFLIYLSWRANSGDEGCGCSTENMTYLPQKREKYKRMKPVEKFLVSDSEMGRSGMHSDSYQSTGSRENFSDDFNYGGTVPMLQATATSTSPYIGKL